jgi:hypothetical protein
VSHNHVAAFALLNAPERWEDTPDEALHAVIAAIKDDPWYYFTSGESCRNFEHLTAYLGLVEYE